MKTTDDTESIIVPAKSTVKPKKPVAGSEQSINYLFCFLTLQICIAFITWTVYAIKYCILQATR